MAHGLRVPILIPHVSIFAREIVSVPFNYFRNQPESQYIANYWKPELLSPVQCECPDQNSHPYVFDY